MPGGGGSGCYSLLCKLPQLIYDMWSRYWRRIHTSNCGPPLAGSASEEKQNAVANIANAIANKYRFTV